ncbi:MAG TPA: uracil-DNA glycosylase [Acidimicrobiia bacterium]|nr:uracil-DNA glycosylase [Acidimicrobiia bacterium]
MEKAFLELRDEALVCTRCRLAQTRTQVVFGVGDPDAELMFIGEAPGFNEDQQGEPFVGAAGQLLTRLLGEIGMTREDVYIANVLKCRPPNNRDPQQDEIDSCKDYLRRQLVLINPIVVVTLGNFATKLLLRTETGITKLRGRVYDWWQGIQLVPTYHPAAALRSGERLVDEMRKDFALVRSVLDHPSAPTPPSPADASQEPEQMNLFR